MPQSVERLSHAAYRLRLARSLCALLPGYGRQYPAMARSPGPALTPCRQVVTTEDMMVERRDIDFEVEGGVGPGCSMSPASLPTRSCCKYCFSLARSSVSAPRPRGEVGTVSWPAEGWGN